ncbi:hypothetical protein KGF57_002221 [Candida theae]|uniref:Uncharacterized protein n=1 Tax=Candida theae TaxID=1198502 RepID=A0AAD5BF79_9ASCO|nr:uncharacterized protein KGF57_002221 [Candida theae]KAI5958787.1 hypothetical protein KGF57_002221 [Candida theae]
MWSVLTTPNPQLAWASVCSIYPIAYVVSIPLTLAFKRYNSYIGELWFVQFLERYIVRKYMFYWFSVIYAANLIQVENGRISLPIKDLWVIGAMKVYLCNLLWLTILLEWFFGSPIFERISVATGAHCTTPDIYREYQCEKAGGTWINAFDSSSHYTMLISNSLLIWRLILPYVGTVLSKTGLGTEMVVENDLESGPSQSSVGIDEGGSRLKAGSSFTKKAVLLISLLFITLWFISFCITSVFYHTIPEKLVGLICGMTVPLLLKSI